MHVAICGPISLELLESRGLGVSHSRGYPFPMTAHLALAYLARGHQVSVITTGTDISEPEYRSGSEGLDVWVVPSRPRARDRALDFFAHERSGVAKAIRQANPDVVHAHWSYEFALAARDVGLPRLVTVHDWAPAIFRQMKDPYRFIRLLMQWNALLKEPNLSAPSEYVARRVETWFRTKCIVVGNGIPLQAFLDAGERRRERDVSEAWFPRVGMLNASDDKRKNVRRALQSWEAVVNSLPKAQLQVAGPSFAPDGECANWARAHGLDRGVIFVGALPPEAVPAWMASLDAFLHPSLEESFGVVLCEAMAAQAVVVAGIRSGAVSEVVGAAGVLTDVASVSAMSDAVIGLLVDQAQRDRLVSQGLAQCERFDMTRVADTYLELLDRLVGQASSE
jgi:L-malate glycosyltransferase